MTDRDEASTPDASRGKANRKWLEALRGKTIRFVFHEGPTKGASYDHTFRDDGTMTWHDAATSKQGEPSTKTTGQNGKTKGPPTKYGSFQVADDVYVVSYLSKSGYTLTVTLNFETDQLFGFASNDQSWHPVRGVFEVIG